MATQLFVQFIRLYRRTNITMSRNRTIEKTNLIDVRHQFRAQGITISQWSEERGFNPALVYAVARGNRKCLRGQSHQIAVALGLKAT